MPYNARCTGFKCMIGLPNADTGHAIITMGVNGVQVATTNYNYSRRIGAATRHPCDHYFEPFLLRKGQQIDIYTTPSTANDLTVDRLQFWDDSMMETGIGISGAKVITRTNGGAWTETANQALIFVPLIDSFDLNSSRLYIS